VHGALLEAFEDEKRQASLQIVALCANHLSDLP